MYRKKYIAQKILGNDTRAYRFIKKTYTSGRLVCYVVKVYINIIAFNIKARKRIPMFSGIEIETINRCNGTCTFCPASIKNDIRVKKTMSTEIFEKIIHELSTMKYEGSIAFHSNNEPLLDLRIYDFVDYARKKCPKSTIFMYTNGTLLTAKGLVRLLKSLDFIVVDWYTDDLKTDYTDKFETWRKAVVSAGIPLNKLKLKIRKRDEILSSRGGDSPNSKIELKKNIIPCFEPYTTMVVRPDGKISMCKCDVYGELTMGDVNTNSLYGIWTSKEYRNLRKAVRVGRNSGKCRHCNFPVY